MVQKISSPNPGWQNGDKVEAPDFKMLSINPKEMKPHESYKLIIGSVVPRPIALVSTIGIDGAENLAPFSFFCGVSSNPPAVAVSVAAAGDGQLKDTAKNINETGEFVVNIVGEWFAEPMVHTASTYPNGVDEAAIVGLTRVPSLLVKPSRIKESPIQMECKLLQAVQVGDGSQGSATLYVGEVKMFHLADQVYKNGRINLEDLKPVARLGGILYGRVTETYEIPVPQVTQSQAP